MAQNVVVLKKFFIQNDNETSKYSIVYAETEEDAIQSVGGLAADEFVMEENVWREYQHHVSADLTPYQLEMLELEDPNSHEYLAPESWVTRGPAAEAYERSTRADGWTCTIGTATLRLMKFI